MEGYTRFLTIVFNSAETNLKVKYWLLPLQPQNFKPS